MNTYVLDSINDLDNWWYRAYFDGGWREENAFRIDQYPVKDGMYIQLFQESPATINTIHESFRSQVVRRAAVEEMIIPTVKIEVLRTIAQVLTFHNVTVTAHNLRADTFKAGVITAIDVILSLADQSELSYDLQWYEQIGTSQVQNFWVERINEHKAQGRCGFVYESGEQLLKRRNHIHLPSDLRIINSPEYVHWFWICI